MLSNVHMMLFLMTFLAKPMFKINKPLFIFKTMDVMWQNIPWLVAEYFVTSQNIMPCGRRFWHIT
jgi:hypothetical protein